MLCGVQVEHEADEGAFETRSRAHVDGKTRTAELGGAFKVEDTEGFAEFPVRLGGESEAGNLAPFLDREVVVFRKPDGHFVAGEVGNAGEQLAKAVVEGRGG